MNVQHNTQTMVPSRTANSFRTAIRWCHHHLRDLSDFVFPRQCVLCGSVDENEPALTVCYCRDCVIRLCPVPVNRCQRCAAEIGPHATSRNGCIHCRDRKFKFQNVVCLGMYDSPLRQALLSAKWSFSAVRMQSLAVLLATERSDELQTLKVDRIIPVPQHWRQRFVRHFNPAWILGSVLAREMHILCDVHLLRRARRTRAQKRVAVSQRFENQAGAFQVRDSHIVAGEHILLVDDVLTSGATCSEAARALLQAGARSCSVAVIARVLDSR